jgi:hypothetical protein
LILVKEDHGIFMLVAHIAISLQRYSPMIRAMLVKEAIVKWSVVENQFSMVQLASDDERISS